MKIGGVGDLHIEPINPESRTDKYYFNVVVGKLAFMLAMCLKHKIEHLFIAGDFFNSPRLSHLNYSYIAKLLNSYRKHFHIHVVPGQHDLYFHNIKNKNIPLMSLHASGLLKYYRKNKRIELEKGTYVYTCPWEAKIPKPDKSDKRSILLIHKMVIGDSKLWEAQEDYVQAKDLLKKFDIVISGDNHNFLLYNYKGNILFNSGSMMRRKTDQKNHKPCFGIIDTKEKECEIIYFPIRPIEEVMDFSKKERSEHTKLDLDPFIKKLNSGTDELGLDYAINVKEEMNILDKRTKLMVKDIMTKCMEKKNDNGIRNRKTA